MLVKLLYVSEAVRPPTDTDLRVLLSASLIRNRRLDVTGMLAFAGKHFVQVLEGREVAVAEVMRRVAKNPLHCELRILQREQVTRRQFGSWSMGFVTRDDLSDSLAQLHALNDTDGRCMAELFRCFDAEQCWPLSA